MSMYERTELLLGKAGIERLKASNVAIFGVGGVGGFAAEAVARAGVGHMTVIDRDTVSESNLNRQIIALHSTLGRPKVDVIRERLLDINPELDITALNMFYLPDTADEIDLTQFDYIIDAVDTVTAKLELAVRAQALGVPLISSMGTGSKIHPEMLEIADVYETSICPLARIMRKECKKRGIKRLRCIYSKEEPITSDRPPGTVSFVPSAAGLLIAAEVIRHLALGNEL